MSWSASGSATFDGTTVLAEISGSPQTGNGAEESKKAMEAAKAQAKTFINSGVLGVGTFSVSLSGHANDGNQKKEGWSNDMVTISIYQK